VLGGSSSINGLLYIRGQRADYDGWRQLGCEGWAWDDVAPYFRRAQHQERGEDEHHGQGGPLNVSDVTTTHTVSDAVLDACEQAGIPKVKDVNGLEQEGATYYQLTVKNGQRWSAAAAYLHPVMGRSNLRVETNALASRVVLEGKRAVGVMFTQNGAERQAKASGEVILAGGASTRPSCSSCRGSDPARCCGRRACPSCTTCAASVRTCRTTTSSAPPTG
jgi:choline dehydrogenase